MLKLIGRSPSFVKGYKEYCQEFYDHHVTWFKPTDPNKIDDGWFDRTADWYHKKELGLVPDQPVSFHYWAVDGDTFIGEFQMRTELTQAVMDGIGSIGYSVRITEQGKGYGQELLRQGLEIAKARKLEKVLLNINEMNRASIHVCEKQGGIWMDTIKANSKDEGEHLMRRYWIYL